MNEYTPITDQVKYRYQLDVGNSPISGRSFDEAGLEFDRWLAAHDAEVRASVAEEREWEYSVVHVQVDGWVERELHLNRQEALDDYGTCGMNCTLMRRRKAGPWEPVEN